MDRSTIFVTGIGLVLAFLVTTCVVTARGAEQSTPEKCAALLVLRDAWEGSELDADQKRTKAKLVRWYRANCRKTQATVVKP